MSRWGGLPLSLCNYCSTYNGPLFWKKGGLDGEVGTVPSLALLIWRAAKSSRSKFIWWRLNRKRMGGGFDSTLYPHFTICPVDKRKKKHTLSTDPVKSSSMSAWKIIRHTVWVRDPSTKPHMYSQCLGLSLYGGESLVKSQINTKNNNKNYYQASGLELSPSEQRVHSSQLWGWAAHPLSFWFKQRRQRESKSKTKKRGRFNSVSKVLSALQWSVCARCSLSISSGSCLQSKSSRESLDLNVSLSSVHGWVFGWEGRREDRWCPPGAVVEEEGLSVYRWAGSLPGRVMLPRWRTGSGWASVLKTQFSNGIRSSLENNRYRYLRVSARKKLCCTSS